MDRPPRTSAPPSDEPRPGRPSLLTEELARTIVEAVREHGFDYVAAEAAGISRHTLATWRIKAERGEALYVELVTQLDAARAEFLGKAMRELATEKRMNPTRFRQLTWLMERLERRLTAKLEVSGVDGGPLLIKNTTLDEASAAAFRAKVLGVGPAEPSGPDTAGSHATPSHAAKGLPTR